jgi:hypothetical protein
MSKSKGRSSQSSQQSSENHLDPDIKALLLSNYGRASGIAGSSQYQPLTGEMIQGFQNPHTQQVIDTSLADLDKSRQMVLQQNNDSAIAAKAFGGSRHGVADALTNSEFADKAGMLAATLRSQGYDRALQTAQSERDLQMNWPLIIQQLLNQSAGLMGNPILGTSQGSSRGYGWNYSTSAPMPAPGG